VTLRAGGLRVRARQRKTRQGVVERCIQPSSRRMAARTIGRETTLDVIGVLDAFVVPHVASVTVRASPGKSPAHMARRALHADVGAGQLELRQSAVVELRALPAGRTVATRAIPGEARLDVVDARRGGEVPGVAPETVRGDAGIASAGMAGAAFQAGVRAIDLEMGELGVIEFPQAPTVQSVALAAIEREAGCLVVDGARLLIILQVAGGTLSVQAGILRAGGALVAGIALRHRMRAEQREPILMRTDGVHAHAPARHRMALVAARPKLPAVDIGVAIRALRAGVGENQLRVTQPALNVLMQPAEAETGLAIVFELRHCAHGGPTRRAMAAQTWNGERSVRAAGGAALEILGSRGREGDCDRQEQP